ncbi:hypothetical protein Dimus_031684, partial [Dionaea muscipula]
CKEIKKRAKPSAYLCDALGSFDCQGSSCDVCSVLVEILHCPYQDQTPSIQLEEQPVENVLSLDQSEEYPKLKQAHHWNSRAPDVSGQQCPRKKAVESLLLLQKL